MGYTVNVSRTEGFYNMLEEVERLKTLLPEQDAASLSVIFNSLLREIDVWHDMCLAQRPEWKQIGCQEGH